MSGTEVLARQLWIDRFRLARPTASDEAIDRAVTSVMRDPHGAYAKEIKDTADRRAEEQWTWMPAAPTPREEDRVRKIPTIFERDPEDRAHVLPNVTAGCEWVLEGEGVPTRKFDGTCTMFDGEKWWARREVKVGKREPESWVHEETDFTTGKRVGWEPIERSPFAAFHEEALAGASPFEPGTYELIGPKINGNPEDFSMHCLVRHGVIELQNPEPITYETLRDEMTGDFRFEGVVWHHPDGRMAKLKKRDFPAAPTPREEDG